MSLPSRTETVIIGAGHNGLAMSRLLSLAGMDHVVLERREMLGGGWQDRWDDFQLVSPNWSLSLPASRTRVASPTRSRRATRSSPRCGATPRPSMLRS